MASIGLATSASQRASGSRVHDVERQPKPIDWRNHALRADEDGRASGKRRVDVAHRAVRCHAVFAASRFTCSIAASTIVNHGRAPNGNGALKGPRPALTCNPVKIEMGPVTTSISIAVLAPRVGVNCPTNW
jgi:hypothetical protein